MTLDLLLFLAQRIDTTNSILIITYRDDEVGPNHPLRRALGGFAGGRPTPRLAPQPLSAAAVSELAKLASASRLDAEELRARTGGNPFFVTEVLADPDSPVPATVRDAVLARVAAVGERGRHALYAAATFLGATPLPMIDAPHDALDACVDAGILVRGPAHAFLRKRSDHMCATIVRLTVSGLLRARRGEPGAAQALEEACELAARTGELQSPFHSGRPPGTLRMYNWVAGAGAVRGTQWNALSRPGGTHDNRKKVSPYASTPSPFGAGNT